MRAIQQSMRRRATGVARPVRTCVEGNDHLADPRCSSAGRHTPQYCSGTSSEICGIAPSTDNHALNVGMGVYLRYEGNIAGQDSSHALTAGLRVTW
jgi:hypothetical protein